MIVQINVWADLLAIAIVAIILFFWGFQIIGNWLTGRFYRKFVLKQWPHHEQIIPPLPKILHGIHVACMIGLGFSGLYIRFPFFEGGRTPLRNLHYILMYIVVANMLYRIYYAYLIDAKEFILRKADILNMVNVMKYYGFFAQSYPHLAKYNPMQKMTYGIMFPILMTLQALTGFSLLWPHILLAPIGKFVGGIAMAAEWARITHFLICMILIMFTGIHVCLSFIEDFPALLVFFGLAKQHVEHEGHGEAHEAPAHGGTTRTR